MKIIYTLNYLPAEQRVTEPDHVLDLGRAIVSKEPPENFDKLTLTCLPPNVICIVVRSLLIESFRSVSRIEISMPVFSFNLSLLAERVHRVLAGVESDIEFTRYYARYQCDRRG